jgi:signal peptidase II
MQAARGTAVTPERSADVPAGPRRTAWLLSVAAVVVIADVLSKVAIVATLHEGQVVHVIGDALRFTLTRNSGAAFGVGAGATIVFTAVAVVVVAVILRTARRLRSRGWASSFGLLLGGALGNLIDRVVRHPAPLRGHVVDWIELPHWPVFNLADSAIVVGGIVAVLLSLLGHDLDGSRRTDSDRP